jgi:hypothetical protein
MSRPTRLAGRRRDDHVSQRRFLRADRLPSVGGDHPFAEAAASFNGAMSGGDVVEGIDTVEAVVYLATDRSSFAHGAVLVSVMKPRLPTAALPLHVIAATGVMNTVFTPRLLAALVIVVSSSSKSYMRCWRRVSKGFRDRWNVSKDAFGVVE